MAASFYHQGLMMKATVAMIGFLLFLATTFVTGCGSVIDNSENFYQKIPRRPINWREYLTD
jgi:hypothetical protein